MLAAVAAIFSTASILLPVTSAHAIAAANAQNIVRGQTGNAQEALIGLQNTNVGVNVAASLNCAVGVAVLSEESSQC
jgi:dihydrodipicolinate reductase